MNAETEIAVGRALKRNFTGHEAEIERLQQQIISMANSNDYEQGEINKKLKTAEAEVESYKTAIAGVEAGYNTVLSIAKNAETLVREFVISLNKYTTFGLLFEDIDEAKKLIAKANNILANHSVDGKETE